MSLDAIYELRQPEYTGENRCEPCTFLNVVIAGILASAIARKSRIGGILAFGVSVSLIYLRGYLVPGTPTLTKQYLPPEVLAWFGKDPSPPSQQGLGSGDEIESKSADTLSQPRDEMNADTTENHETTVDPASFLLETEILVPCQDRDDLCLDEEFKEAWQTEIDSVDAESVAASDAVTAFGLTSDDEYNIEALGDARLLTREGEHLGQWPSQAALVADVAAARAFENTESEWKSLPPEAKGQLLNALRMFLETCPTSGGDIDFGTETVESCCQSYNVVAATCSDTGERLFEQPVEEL